MRTDKCGASLRQIRRQDISASHAESSLLGSSQFCDIKYAACTSLLSRPQTIITTSQCTIFMSIHPARRRSMLCCPCIGQLTLSLEEQGQNLKVSMCYPAQGALSVCFTLPGGVVVAVHCCLAVNCVGIHWLQQTREHLSAAAVMGQTACSIAAD